MRRIVLCIALAGCGSSALKKAGESCSASAECDPGLLCDLNKSVCATKGSIDAAVNQPDGPRSDAPVQQPDAPADSSPPADAADDAPPD